MSPEDSSQETSKPDSDELLDRHGFRRGQLFAGKYRLEGLLGEGGMGLVLLATHVDLQRTVAIKVVRNELAQNDEIVERLLGEAQVAASIRSEHVTRVLDLGRLDSGTPYIVLEYLQGRDLAALLDEHGPLPFETAVDFVLQVCDALAEAHAAGIIHRDLKPENLFLTHRPDGTPIIKLIDFGISKNLAARDRRARLTNPAQLVGSPYYMAPEQMRGSGVVDARADVWALGVVLYELCTGQTPFAADSIPAVCHMVMQEEPTPPRTFAPDMPEELEAVICTCLRKDPDERYTNVAQLAAALGGFGSPEAFAYVERIERVLSRPRRWSLPDVEGFAADGFPHSGSGHSWRTPAPLASTRGSLHDPRRLRRRSRGSSWLTLAAGLLFGAAGAAAVVVLPSRFGVDEATAELANLRSLAAPVASSAAPAAATAAPPPAGLAEPEIEEPDAADSPPPQTSAAEPGPEPESESKPKRAKPRARKAQAAPPTPSAAEPAAEPVAVAPTASVAPPAAEPAQSATPSPARSKSRAAVNAWDPKNFGGRR